MSQNIHHGDGGTCFGDSGGPTFFVDPSSHVEYIVAVTSWGDTVCKSTNNNYRVDLERSRSFIDDMIASNPKTIGLEAAKVRLAVFLPRFTFLRVRERGVTSGARASGVHAALAQPRSACVPFDSRRVMPSALRRRRVLDRCRGGLRRRASRRPRGRLAVRFALRSG